MIVTLCALLLAALILMIARHVAIERHRTAATAAQKKVLIQGAYVDAAEVVWAARQSLDAANLTLTVASPRFASTREIVVATEALLETLPLDVRLELISVRARLERTRLARETLTSTATRLASGSQSAATDAVFLALGKAIGPSTLQAAGRMVRTESMNALIPQSGGAGLWTESGSSPWLDSLPTTMGDGAGEIVGAIIDHHIPVFTIASAVHRAKKSHANGLETDRVYENLAWDAGVKGGSILGGAAAGTLVLPGVGTLIGGVLGAVFGDGAARIGKQRHLGAAKEKLLYSTEELGSQVTDECLDQLLEASEHLLMIKQEQYLKFLDEADSVLAARTLWQRVFRPCVGQKLLERVIECAQTDIEYEERLQVKLEQAVVGTAGSLHARGFVWAAGRHFFDWIDLDGPDLRTVQERFDEVVVEREKLALAR